MRRALALPAVAVLAACASPEPGAETEPTPVATAARPVVAAVSAPLAYFAERIGGGDVEVLFPAPPDVDPADWRPEPEVVARYQAADRVLLNGAGYARWVEMASLPSGRLVDTTAAVRDRLIEVEEAVTHRHGGDGEHTHRALRSTTWLDPTLAIEQARAVHGALAELLPERAPELTARLDGLIADLSALDERLATWAESLGDAPVLFSHPVYDYLIRRYGLNARSLHWEPDVAPDAEAWAELDELLAQHPARFLLWEGQPLAPIEAELDERGVTSVVFAPGGNRPAQFDHLSVMRQNLERLDALAVGR